MVFNDDNRIERYDEIHSLYEDRYITIGDINGISIIVTVVYTERQDVIRIISARAASKKKRRHIMLVRKEIDITQNPTKEQIEMLQNAASAPIKYDEDCPALSDEELQDFKWISKEKQLERRKQTVTLRLSPQALNKAKSLGKGYTSVLSRILENVLTDNEQIKHYL